MNVQPPFTPDRSKATVYEGGVWVPLIIAGSGVAQPDRMLSHIVNVVDLYATIVELLNGNAETGVDSVSLVPYMAFPDQEPLRQYNYTECFPSEDSDPELASLRARAIRTQQYKLVQQSGKEDELYDLEHDRFEMINLNGQPNYTEIIGELKAVLEQLTGKNSP